MRTGRLGAIVLPHGSEKDQGSARRGSKRSPETTPAAPMLQPQDAPPSPPPVHRGPEVVHHPVALQGPGPRCGPHRQASDAIQLPGVSSAAACATFSFELSPKDFDIATGATPRQVKRLFSNCRIIGRRFRLAHVYFPEREDHRGRDVPRARHWRTAAPRSAEAEARTHCGGRRGRPAHPRRQRRSARPRRTRFGATSRSTHSSTT